MLKHCKKQTKDRYDGISVCIVCGAWLFSNYGAEVWNKAPVPELMWVMRDKTKIRMADMEDTHLLRALKYFQAQAVTEALKADGSSGDALKDRLAELRQRALSLRVEALEEEMQRRGLNKWDKFLGRTVEGLL